MRKFFVLVLVAVFFAPALAQERQRQRQRVGRPAAPRPAPSRTYSRPAPSRTYSRPAPRQRTIVVRPRVVYTRPYYTRPYYYRSYGYGWYGGYYGGIGWGIPREPKPELTKIEFILDSIPDQEKEGVERATVLVDGNNIGTVRHHRRVEPGQHEVEVIMADRRIFRASVFAQFRTNAPVNLMWPPFPPADQQP